MWSVSIQSFGEKEFRCYRCDVAEEQGEYVSIQSFGEKEFRSRDMGARNGIILVSIQSFGEKEFRSRWSRTLVYSVFQVPKARITLKTMIQPPQSRQTIRRAKGQTLS